MRGIWGKRCNAGAAWGHRKGPGFCFQSQATPLVIVDGDSFFAELLSEHSILREELLDGVLLPAGIIQSRGARNDDGIGITGIVFRHETANCQVFHMS